jgi:hypothetical protein
MSEAHTQRSKDEDQDREHRDGNGFEATSGGCLSKFAADTGDGSALKASQVANMLANALQTGPAYEVEGVAREFDLVRKEVVDGHSGEEAYGPGSSVTDGCG